MIEAEFRPHGPYSLRLSGRLRGDATRTIRDGVVRCQLTLDGGPEGAVAWQRPDGLVRIRAESDAGVERMRFVLALEDDHSEFLRRFADDPLLRHAVRAFGGLRPMRVATVAHALLRALCGQLIESSRARQLERLIVRNATPERDGLHAPPSSATLAAFSAAELRRLGLHARRAATLIRLCNALDLERLRGVSTADAAARLSRERGLGPWSVGVICLEGLGRTEQGLARDLGLVKLCSALSGRRAEPWETDALLERYGEWAGLASVFLLRGFAQGIIPLPASGRKAAA
jgi:AraC family transcriptional regulator, regulatory protein of adaptative response / DNA-3-methyladenine glycosylase II